MADPAKVVTSIGAVKPHVRAAYLEIIRAIPASLQPYFAWGYPGRGTGDHSRGLAVDIMNYSLGGGVNNPGPERRALQTFVKTYALTHHTRLGMTYIIADRRIASEASSPDWTWRTYTGKDPHTNHVHMSFKSSHTYRPLPVKPPTQDEEDAMTQAEFTAFLKVALDDPDVKRKVGDAILARLYLEYPPGTGAGGERLQTTVAGAIFRADQMARIAAAQEQPSASQKQASASAPDPAD